MLNLSNYIKHGFVKNIFSKSSKTISNIEEANLIANSIVLENVKYNLIFECSYLKNYFFTIIKKYHNDAIIVNCESSEDRLNEDINLIKSTNPGICIFDHVNNCTNINLLKSIKIPSILIC